MKRGNLIALLILLALPSAAPAQRTMDFDTDWQGNPILPGEIISEQYAGWGAHFTPDVFGGNDAYGNPYAVGTILSVTNFDFSPNLTASVQGNLLNSFNDWFNTFGSMNFWIQFDHPVHRVSADLYMDHLLFNPDGQHAGVIYGFDKDLDLVGFVEAPGTGETAHLDLPNPTNADLYYIGFEDNYNVWTAFDNIRVNAAPEPSPSALLMGALPFLGFVAWRRHRGR